MRIEFLGLDLEYLPDQNAGLALAAGCLIIAIVLWCIYNIFQYGIILQKESDETI